MVHGLLPAPGLPLAQVRPILVREQEKGGTRVGKDSGSLEKHSRESGMRKRLLSQPVHHLLLLSFILLALIPVSLLGVKVYQAAWDNAWREIDEKHRLLATNLASPIGIYVSDHRAMLGLLAKSIKHVPADTAGNAANGRLLEMAVSHLKGFGALTLVGVDGRLGAP